ncbi:MAG TPA: transketolase C-terminal domain-containing protein, partial [Rhodothermales bacterium]
GFREIPVGRGRRIRPGTDLAFISYGAIGNYLQEVIPRLLDEGVDAAHYDLRFCKPLDDDLLHEVFSTYDRVVTVEDGVVQGGAGSAVLEWMVAHQYTARVRCLGLPDRFVEHGSQRELHDLIGIGPDGLFEAAISLLQVEDTADR